MQINDYSILNWSDRITPASRNVDLLGIWSQHLKIQVQFTRGITSVTPRIRYYTLIAYYSEYLSKIVDDINDYERIFILACLSHHDGEYKDLDQVQNKTRFRDDWDAIKTFDLDFKISGQGWSYYVKQLAHFRSVWNEYGNIKKTPINEKLASSLKDIDLAFFKKKQFNKSELRELGDQGLCICKSNENYKEINVMTKLLFGFFSKKTGNWDIDEKEYNMFKEGKLNLEINNDFVLSEDIEVLNMNIKRRNTLLMFLKIINETNPPIKEYRRYIWDAIYFRQNSSNNNYLDFGQLEPVRRYWELLQLNIYYMYAIENYLDLINQIINLNNPIKKKGLLKTLDYDIVNLNLGNILDKKINKDLNLSDLIEVIDALSGNDISDLNDFVNESFIFDGIRSKDPEEKLVNILIMLILLYRRYLSIDTEIKDYAFNNIGHSFYSLFISDIVKFIEENGEISIYEFLDYLCDLIIKRHIFESTLRFYDSNTRNWLFTEEDGLLFGESKKIPIGTRDNRWGSIKSLLLDLNFIYEVDGKISLTEKAIIWLKRIELI
ncbi:MAG: hypothetical protein QM405_02415 [Euryarchaeota archaeon]|jgi:hypothetical protein|nr:hypothetical protein [Euryarchaeota archaeon]